jgi:glycerophosphoryl diester phosphodiesterase
MIVMLLLAGFLGADGSAEDSPPPARQLVLSDRLLIIAHRGASADFPENTLPAFAAGVEAGADLVELDYRHSADGVPVVLHDETLDRTTDARALFGGQKLPVGGDVIQPGSVTLIERNAGDAKTCVELLRRLGLVDRVVVQACDWNYLRDCRKLAPEVALVALGEKELTPARAAEAADSGALGVGWNAKTLTAAEIAAAHARGLRVWTWTVDDPARARALVAARVNGLITNRPAEIRQIVESR